MSVPTEPIRSRHAWLREPLLHFAVLGALLFGIDAWIAGRQDDPRVITVDASVDQEALSVFRGARGRDPDEDELYALRRIWLDNEVLYREGIALQMDRGDKAIRDRVIFKALTAVNAGLQLPAVDDESLRAWFEKNRARYDEPPRVDFLEAVLSGDAAEADATALAAQLNGGGSGDTNAGLRVFKGRPHANLVQSYGEPFAQALQAAPVGRWQALPQGGVWRVVQLQAVTPAKPADFEPLRGVVLQDWKDAVMAEQRTAAGARWPGSTRCG
ncbi:peptidylprolyl isomerase [Aquabacterium sp. J223]|uniref:peptidylprolyl isomerase n=1 Tax=Aquabacterium sp. J223 TaxID=2898431 RepID=UPI0021AD78F5|nr:peptidylprolyl isomerase [Aquabacterium sp. J223]UUX94460.1 peptidyl-prolyl cis-trans isomerase [Aquabacterium sp. J223]